MYRIEKTSFQENVLTLRVIRMIVLVHKEIFDNDLI